MNKTCSLLPYNGLQHPTCDSFYLCSPLFDIVKYSPFSISGHLESIGAPGCVVYVCVCSVAYVYGGTHKVYLIRNTVRNYIGHNQWLWLLRGVCDYEKFVHKIRSINFGTFSIWVCVCVCSLCSLSRMDGAI